MIEEIYFEGRNVVVRPKETYTPNPIDTSHVPFPPELNDILEVIAKSVHDTWAQQRIRDGWRWGPFKDDREKTTPLLVPYEDLPYEEQEYDRITARQTILQLLSNGYRIVRE
ncbi:MAG: Ryanodine receptor Ryr [Clostridia bacterium]|nr:Ryanodine receptor Ryr [Clostridia bacterium]